MTATFSNDPRIKKILEKAKLKRKQLEEVSDDLSKDVMNFSSIGVHELPDLSVFDKVKLDAGACIPTQVITAPVEINSPVDNKSSSVSSSNHAENYGGEGSSQDTNLVLKSKQYGMDGPYFKIDEFGRRKLDISKIVLGDQNQSLNNKMSKEKLQFKVVNEHIPTKNNQSNEKKAETLGPKWFDMKAADITPELKQDLLIIKNRAALDPKQFYKKDNSKTLPKFFQVGTIVESKADFYSGRMTKKERKETLVESLLSDYDKKQYLKKKFLDIQEKKKFSIARNRFKKKSNNKKRR